MPTSNVLFVCEDNAFTSVLAEAYVARAGRGLWRAFSAGCAPAREFHPTVIDLLRAKALRPHHHAPRSVAAFALAGSPRIDLVITLGGTAELPALPGEPPVRRWADQPVARDGRETFAWVVRRADALLLATPVNARRLA
jgi:protein-tyrosine-phosphatase